MMVLQVSLSKNGLLLVMFFMWTEFFMNLSIMKPRFLTFPTVCMISLPILIDKS